VVRGVFGDPKVRIVTLKRRAVKKHRVDAVGRVQMGWYDRKIRQVRDLSCGDMRILLELEVRRIDCRSCGKVK
jgi:transposase